MQSFSARISPFLSKGCVAYLLFSSATVFYYTLFGQGNDFPIFHRAGSAMQSLEDPWLTSSDPTYSIYLNGPNTSLFFMLSSLLPLDQGLLLVRVLTVGSIPILARIVLKQFGFEAFVWSASLLLLCSFPVRSNLEYGSLYVIYLFLAIFTITFAKLNQTLSAHVSIGVFTGLCLDYKPQSFLFLLLILGNRFRVFGFLATLISGSTISVIFTGMFPYQRWLETILVRSESTFKSPDQMSILGISWELGIPLWIPGFIVLFFLANVAFWISTFWSHGNRIFLSCAGFIALAWLNFFLHPTDLMIVPILLILSVVISTGGDQVKVQYFALGACLVWSNNFWVQLCILLAVLIGIHKFPRFKEGALWLLIPSCVFAISLQLFPDEQNVIRHLFNYIPVAICLLKVDRLINLFQPYEKHRDYDPLPLKFLKLWRS